MPRPKRSKVAPSAPIPLPHLAKPAVASAAQKQRDLFSPTSSGRVTTTSDDSDGLVVSKKTGTRDKGLKGQEYRMSGALAPEDIGSTRLKPPSNQTRAALSKIAREADYAKRVAEAKAARVETQAEAATELDQIPSSIPTESIFVPKPTEIGVGNSSAVHGVHMGLGSRIGETPRQQPSILGATFKKRARQPSLLQMLQIQNDPSDNSDDDDQDDFHPDDESTPMIKSMSQPDAQRTSSSSRQTSGSRKRKLATPEIQVPASQTHNPPSSPPTVPPQDQEELYDLPAEAEEAEEESRPEPTLPQPRAARTPQRRLDSDTLAPPHSSSSPEKAKPRKIHAKTTKTTQRPQQQPKRKTQQPSSPLSSHASTTTANPSPSKPTAPLKPLTTATLQNLLPRRRARPPKNTTRSEYDFPTSSDVELDNTGLGEDEDELSFHAPMKLRRKKKKKNDGGSTTAAAVQQKRGGNEKGKGKDVPLINKRVSRTYTRKPKPVDSDDAENAPNDDLPEDENADGDDNDGRRDQTPTRLLDARAQGEMKRLADKFREVDEYALDFEDLTGNSSSQMRDAR